MRRALEISKASLGAEHPSTSIVAKNYNLLLNEIEAAKLASQARANHPGSLPRREGHTSPKDEGKS